MFWLRARPLWDTAKLVKMTSSICWVTFNQNCYLQLVFSIRPSHWNYSLADRAWAPRLSVRVDGPPHAHGVTREHAITSQTETRGELQAKAIDGFRSLQWMRMKLNFNTLTAVFIRWDGIDDEMNSFLHQYTDEILIKVWIKANVRCFSCVYLCISAIRLF